MERSKTTRVSDKDLAKLRLKCQTDLYFLAKTVLGKDLEEEPHREICNVFVTKDPRRHYTEWSKQKNRLLMVPRGSFKSTLDVVDCVQAIINDPNIRILIITAEKGLSEAFVGELRHYFLIQEEGQTQFQMLFPEFCISAKTKTNSTEFTTPARKVFKKEPTVWSSSSGANLPGWHCDFLKLDDCVNNLNSSDEIQVKKTIEIFNYARKLVDPGGYVDVIGTPYNPNDLYSYIPKHVEEDNLIIYARPAWEILPSGEKKLEKQRTAEDYKLFFPSRLTYEFLRKEQKYDPITFESQYLINARAEAGLLFSEKSVRESMISWKSIPKELKYYASWDLGYKTNSGSNISAGAVIALDRQGRMYIIDMVAGRYPANELTFEIADQTRKYPLQLTGIEDVNGAQWLASDINNQAAKLGCVPKIYWIPVDRSRDAKYNRIIRLSPLFDNKKLFISDGCAYGTDIIDQFLNYTGSKSGADDMIDAISLLPTFVNLAPEEDVNQEKYQQEWEKLRAETINSMIYPTAPITPPSNLDIIEDAEVLDYFST